MKKILLYVALVLFAVVTTSLGDYIKFFGISVNLALVYTILYAVKSSPAQAAIMGCLCGLIMDLSGVNIPGINALIVMYISLGISYVANRFFYESKIFELFSVLLCVFFAQFFSLMITRAIFGTVSQLYASVRYILPSSALSVVAAVPMSFVIRWLKNEYIRGI